MKQMIISSLIKKNLIPGNSTALAELVFSDLLHLLNFIHRASKDGALKEDFVFNEQIEYLDEIWHHFILHTKAYYDYCHKEFGELIHHSPISEQMSEPSDGSERKSFSEICKYQMNVLIQYEGREFVDRVFFQYPIIFSSEAT